MNSLLFKKKLLANGVELDLFTASNYTGDFVTTSDIRESMLTSYVSGNGKITLEYESPFFPGQGVPFWEWTGLKDSYGITIFTTTPMSNVRAICNGSGKFWAAITSQN